MKSVHKLLSTLFAVVLLLLVAGKVNAAQVQNMSVDLSTTDPSQTATHTVSWDNISSTALYSIVFEYCTTPSDSSCDEGSININTSTATKGTLTNMTTGDWSLVTGTAKKPRLHNTNAGEDLGTNSIAVEMIGIDNHNIGDCNPSGNSSTDTCYLRLTTHSAIPATSGNLVDEGVASVTVVNAVSVDARVDPLFVFTVSSDVAGNVHSQITTSATSQYDQLDFGNLTANTPRYIGHMLRVTTNTENGYSITMRMASQMTGSYVSNNIDPFKGTFANPTTWTEPTGTIPNQDTAWIGYNTNDWGSGDNADDVESFNNQLFGPVNSTDNVVMEEGSSDNGATPKYVTYGLEANVFQPADTYNGEIIYTALPSY